MVGAGGIEPPHGGIKIRCLTAWLRPIIPRSFAHFAQRWGTIAGLLLKGNNLKCLLSLAIPDFKTLYRTKGG